MMSEFDQTAECCARLRGALPAFDIGNRLRQRFAVMRDPFSVLFLKSLKRKHEVSIRYFGRTSEFLLVTAERFAIPEQGCALEQVLLRLRQRGERWADELADSHVVCSVDGKVAALSDCIRAGCEIGIASRKSIFEA